MTIYTSKQLQGEKKENATNVPPPEVVTENAVEKKENEANLAAVTCSSATAPPHCGQPPTLVTVNSRARRSGCANVCLLLTALLVVSIGVIGGTYLYKHLAQRTFRGWCGVKYYEFRDEERRRAGRLQGHHQSGLMHNSRLYYGQFEEHVEIDRVNGNYEKIDVPDLEECRRATILHDFERNLTAIVDKVNSHCFIMPLNRSTVTPPKDFWDLLDKLSNGYYLPDAELVREHYRVVYPRIINLGPFGYHIWRECHRFTTYHLERIQKAEPRVRRSAAEEEHLETGDTVTEESDAGQFRDIQEMFRHVGPEARRRHYEEELLRGSAQHTYPEPDSIERSKSQDSRLDDEEAREKSMKNKVNRIIDGTKLMYNMGSTGRGKNVQIDIDTEFMSKVKHMEHENGQ